MADEAKIVTLLGNAGNPVEYDIADGTAIPKGSLMVFDSSPGIIKISAAAGDFFCGIANCEKKALDGKTKMAVITKCIAEIKTKIGGSAVLGKPVKIDGVNLVDPATDDTVAGQTLAVAQSLETLGASVYGEMFVNV